MKKQLLESYFQFVISSTLLVKFFLKFNFLPIFMIFVVIVRQFNYYILKLQINKKIFDFQS